MRWFALLIAVLALAPLPALAEVKSAADNGFDIVSTADVALPPAQTYALLVTPSRWWIMAHSYSGEAARLTIDPRAGGCFCETLKDKGAVEHGRVIFVEPGKMLRLDAALGPLQAEGVNGTLSFTLVPAGAGTRLEMRYAVGGYMAGGLGRLASVVDTVLSEQLAALKAEAERSAEK